MKSVISSNPNGKVGKNFSQGPAANLYTKDLGIPAVATIVPKDRQPRRLPLEIVGYYTPLCRVNDADGGGTCKSFAPPVEPAGIANFERGT